MLGRQTIASFMLIAVLGIACYLGCPRVAFAARSLEWRADGLWVLDDQAGSVRFEPIGEATGSPQAPKVAALSPDREWIAFARHTGGGFENEGQSCFVARWDGGEERPLLETDYLIPDVYWLEGEGSDYVVVQQSSGGTAFRSFFSVVAFDTGETVAEVEGRVYGTSNYGCRHTATFAGGVVGLRYEVLGADEEPLRWGILYVDELIDHGSCPRIAAIDGGAADHPIADGKSVTAWIAPSEPSPCVTLTFEEDAKPTGLFIVSGWNWHQPPASGERGWEGIDWFPLYDRPRNVQLTFADGSTADVELADTRSAQWIGFPENAATERVTLTFASVYRGIEFDQVAISEVYLF